MTDTLEDEEPEIPNSPIAIHTRMALVERDLRAHSRSITELVQNDRRQETVLTELQEWKLERLLVEAREQERDKSLYDRLERMEKIFSDGVKAVADEVKTIKGNFGRIFWIAMGTIIPAVILGVALILVFGIKMIPT